MGTLTITTTAQQDARIVAAFGVELGLGRNATAAEVKAAVIQRGLREVVQRQEMQAQLNALTPFVPLDPT